MSVSRLEVLGVPLDCVTMGQAVDRIRGFLQSRDFHLVVTLGSEMINHAQTDVTFREVVRQASLVVPDSIGTLLAARLNGYPLRERVAGVELIQVMAQQLGPAARIFLLGGAPGVAEIAAQRLLQLAPGAQIVGCRDGYFQDHQEVVQAVASSGANILLAAMGFPKQETWLAEHGPACGVRVGIGVGGSFDVLSGRVKRAPVWMQRAGLEWFYRFALQPTRWRRLIALPKFALRVLSGGKQAVKPLESPGAATPLAEVGA
jgi:N-acetylglucosaminyldiphosphoundecaprenol N-acetyl-beta-D-mannosaminyltransferase